MKSLDNKPSIFNNETPSDLTGDNQDDPFFPPLLSNIKIKKKEDRVTSNNFHNIRIKRPSGKSTSQKNMEVFNNNQINLKDSNFINDVVLNSDRTNSAEKINTNKLLNKENCYINNINSFEKEEVHRNGIPNDINKHNINSKAKSIFIKKINNQRDLSSRKKSSNKVNNPSIIVENVTKKRNKTAKIGSKNLNIFKNANGNYFETNRAAVRVKTTKRNNNLRLPKTSESRRRNGNDFAQQQLTGWNIQHYPNQYGGNVYLNNINYLGVGKKKTTKMKDKLPQISKKQLKEQLNKLNQKNTNDYLNDSEEIPKEIMEQFTTNRKNFFQVRKDIPEVDEDEQNDTENDHQTEDNKKIMFPLIFKYFSNE